jgi:hypothetical protein
MCLRDFEDMLKKENTIYYEHLQKGENTMSIKDWKNKEISQLLSEAWGFKFNSLQEFEEFNGTGELQAEGEEEIEELAQATQARRGRKGRPMPKPAPEPEDEDESLEEFSIGKTIGKAGMLPVTALGKIAGGAVNVVKGAGGAAVDAGKDALTIGDDDDEEDEDEQNEEVDLQEAITKILRKRMKG